MPSSAIAKMSTFNVSFTISSEIVVKLVLVYLEKHPKVTYEELNLTYIRNIVKELLGEHGISIVHNIDPKVLLKRQDLLVHIRGMIEL